MNILEIKNLKKYYNNPRGILHAVDDVTLSIAEGEILGVVGESGCGKSTLGRVILRLIEPTSGEINFMGTDIVSLSKSEMKKMRTRMQMIFQDPYSSLDPRMSVSQLISEPLFIYNICTNKKEVEERVDGLMETVGLDLRYRNAFPHELDGGRRQRIGIARALSLEASFIVCDEPVSALDVSIQAQILNLLQNLREKGKLTYMFITHDLSVVYHLTNNICVMYLGRVVEYCESKELFTNTLHPYSQVLLSAIPSIDIHNRKERIILSGEVQSPIEPPDECRFAPRCNFATDECFASEPMLREVSPGHMVSCHKI